MTKKVKIVTGVIIAIIASIIIACANFKNSTSDNINITRQSTAKWKQKVPQLFNNVGYSKLIESYSNTKQNVPESMVHLAGRITNPFGVRDDILDYILAHTNNNESALLAGIKFAQNEQSIYFSNISQQEAIKLATNNALVGWCIVKYLGKDNSFKIIDNVDSLMRNTKERDRRMWDIDTRYFGWQVLGSGLTGTEEDERCKNGQI